MDHESKSAAALRSLARAQGGVVSAAQAALLASRRTIQHEVDTGRWLVLHRGIYCLNLAPTWLSWAWAGVLLGGDHAAVGATAALHLDGLIPDEPSPVTVFTHRQITSPPHEIDLRRGKRPRRGTLPRTPVETSLLDAWPMMRDEDFLVVAGRALQLRKVSPGSLLRALESRRRCPRRRDLVDLLALGADGIHSPLERMHAQIERDHCLPRAVRQRRQRAGFVDALYEEFGLVVELDGRRGHENAFRDMRRDNAHTRAGLTTLRFGRADLLAEPCGVALQIAEALIGGGWVGVPQRCPRCLNMM